MRDGAPIVSGEETRGGGDEGEVERHPGLRVEPRESLSYERSKCKVGAGTPSDESRQKERETKTDLLEESDLSGLTAGGVGEGELGDDDGVLLNISHDHDQFNDAAAEERTYGEAIMCASNIVDEIRRAVSVHPPILACRAYA